MRKKKCEGEGCGEPTRIKYLGKIRGVYLCKKCRRKNRLKHREETIEQEGIGEELKELDRKQSMKYREKYKKKRLNKPKDTSPPKIKGSKYKKPGKNNCCYYTRDEKQFLFRLFIGRGMTPEEAKEEIENRKEALRELTKKLKKENISDEDVEKRKLEMLEELWKN